MNYRDYFEARAAANDAQAETYRLCAFAEGIKGDDNSVAHYHDLQATFTVIAARYRDMAKRARQ